MDQIVKKLRSIKEKFSKHWKQRAPRGSNAHLVDCLCAYLLVICLKFLELHIRLKYHRQLPLNRTHQKNLKSTSKPLKSALQRLERINISDLSIILHIRRDAVKSMWR